MIADTHLPRGGRQLPPECFERIAAADLLVHAGDFSTASAFDEIASIGPPVIAVHGNVDDPELRASLPDRTTVQLEGVRIAVIHDAGPRKGRLARMRRRFSDAHAVVFGHSHQPFHEREGEFQIFNPGSPTERRRAPSHAMGLAEIDGAEIQFRHVELS